MQQVTVGTKYQIVIPKEVREKVKSLKPGVKVSVQSVDEDTIAIKTNPQDWVERVSGMMTEAWKDFDPAVEVKKMRDEWEERLRKLEKDFKKQ